VHTTFRFIDEMIHEFLFMLGGIVWQWMPQRNLLRISRTVLRPRLSPVDIWNCFVLRPGGVSDYDIRIWPELAVVQAVIRGGNGL